MSRHAGTTQGAYPWRATVRTIFQFVVGLAAAWVLIIEAIGVDTATPWVMASVAISGALTRVMALPVVEELLQQYIPWLAAAPLDD